MDSDKVFTLFEAGEELFNVDLDFHAEHENLGEEPFLLKEDEELLGIVRGNEDGKSSEGFDAPTLTNASMNVIRFVGRYGRVIRSLPPVQYETFSALLELFEFYLYSLFTAFGLNTHSFFGQNKSPVPFRYPHLHKMVNQIRWKIQHGKFGADVFEPEVEPAEDSLVSIVAASAPSTTNSPPPLVKLDETVA